MSDGSEPLAALRAAAARLDDLDGRAHLRGSDAPSPASSDSDATSLASSGFDPTEHADRFEDLHGALVTVLAEIERVEQGQQARPERT